MDEKIGAPTEEALGQLGEGEPDLSDRSVHRAFPGIPVQAWVRSKRGVEQVHGEVLAWTVEAVELTWRAGHQTQKAWVRRSALTNRPKT